MSHAFITVTIPFDASRVDAVEAVLKGLGNPAQGKVNDALNTTGIVHFMSLMVVPGYARAPAQLLLEASADGGYDVALKAIAEAVEDPLNRVFAQAGIRFDATLYDVLQGHSRSLGASWWSTPGLEFPGTPGMSVRRILQEDSLTQRISVILDGLPSDWSSLQRLEHARNEIWRAGDTKWAFVPEAAPCLVRAPESGLNPLVKGLFGEAITAERFDPITGSRTLAKLAVSAVVTFLWPLLLPFAVAVAMGWLFGGLAAAWKVFLWSVVFLVVGLPIAAILAYVAFRGREDRDKVEDIEPAADLMADVMANETFYAQNLLFSVSALKPGGLRRFTVRLAFWSVGLVRYFCRPGFLGSNRVIHFARWFIVPGTDKLVFLSNYDGTWQGYVGDFVTNKAGASGVNAIWSNCVGFPRTRNLVSGGSSDRDRLVRWAHRQQRPVLFWYSAYPTLTTDRIRINAAIRQGLASAASDADAADWLACFGSAPRPASALQIAEIPTLVFGGLSRLRFAACHVVSLAADSVACRQWLAEIGLRLTYGEALEIESALVVGLSATALAKIGLPAEALGTFPVAFQQGMAVPYRSRALGDTGERDPSRWDWGGPNQPSADVLVLIYATSSSELAKVERDILDRATHLGHAVAFSQPLELGPDKNVPLREPFGFVDGVSQLAVRGTRRARHASDVAEPGEFVLGYPDSLGRFPPSPSIAAGNDPEHLLPDVGPDPHRQRPEFSRAESTGHRDIGRNGTFLVVRQLAQNVDAFKQWLDDAVNAPGAESLSPDPRLRRELIAAKLVGRWRDGTSLVRYPDRPGTMRNPRAAIDNDFRFGDEDPGGLHCPLGAHIRRANPRDSFAPGSKEQLATTNTHRMLRVGRPYRSVGNAYPGLLFMCLNANIERQFEFVQTSWLLNPSFHGLANEPDPMLGHGPNATLFTVPTNNGPLLLRGLSEFVRPRGGGYFFLPGRTAFDFLVRGGWW